MKDSGINTEKWSSENILPGLQFYVRFIFYLFNEELTAGQPESLDVLHNTFHLNRLLKSAPIHPFN
ncbi:hypothetical protein D3H55_02285 [Bacillus salacetis]|uniref:Uncharacterized protein n=1 Tax=Bacillus salacetis TaxID=2315464 RepID=A0A3A1R7D4_9BACI|nr:hypothetical protein D3H55_02285 [Bacillus salacetis]